MIGFVVRATESRREAGMKLFREVSRFPAVISWHSPGRSLPESYADAWERGAELRQAWTVQLEDDVVLAPDFFEETQRLLSAVPVYVELVSLFNPALLRQERLPERTLLEVFRGVHFCWAQALAMRTEHVASHNRFVLANTRRDRTDNATGQWLASRGTMFARAWPSIVQHGDMPSLLGHDGKRKRDAQSFTARYGQSASSVVPT